MRVNDFGMPLPARLQSQRPGNVPRWLVSRELWENSFWSESEGKERGMRPSQP